VLLAALLRPVTELFHRRLSGPLSALLTLFLAAVVMVGLGYLIGVRFARQLPSLIEQLVGTVHQLRAELASRGVAQLQLDHIEASVVDWLQRNRSEAVGYLTTGAGYFIEFFTLTVLTLFITFFLLYDGERIWRWLIVRGRRGSRAGWTGLGGPPGPPSPVTCGAPWSSPPSTAS
jgi:predicted PurR-regulated permease PerM